MNHSRSPKYLSEIDGLRALAVLAVLLYHLDFKWISGGYAGVDVFFVISGFLITRNIQNQVHSDKGFSFLSFYGRRLRRLFPSFFTTVFVSSILGMFILTPEHLKEVSGAALSSMLFASNIFFWMQSGYFDSDAIVKPLLHIWSLSIEEQFYLLWPAVVVLALKLKKSVSLSLVILVIALNVSINSFLATNNGIVEVSPSSLFYLLPFRVFEFSIGALLCYFNRPKNNLISELSTIAGTILVLASFIYLTGDDVFPTWNGLLPCVGTALLIFGGKANASASIYRLRPLRYIGKISYTLYLTHWPTVVYWRYISEDRFDLFDKLGVAAISLLLAIILTKYIEDPFRYKKGNLLTAFFKHNGRKLAFAVSFVVVLASIWTSEGWGWRYPQLIQKLTSESLIDKKNRSHFVETRNTDFEYPSKTKVLISGDSHGSDFFNSLKVNEHLFEDLSFGFEYLDEDCFYKFMDDPIKPKRLSQTTAKKCDDRFPNFINSTKVKSADYIFYSTNWFGQSWNDYGIKYLPHFDKWIKQNTSTQLIIFGKNVAFVKHVPTLVSELSIKTSTRNEISDHILKFINGRHLSQNLKVKEAAEELNLKFVSKDPFYCPKGFPNCEVFDENGHLMFFDQHHVGMHGAKQIGRNAYQIGLFKKIIQKP